VKDREFHELKGGEEFKAKGAEIATFFDLDGTLLPLPSLETRLCRMLRYRKRIGLRHGFAWLREALHLLPRGIGQVLNGNKAYLRGIPVAEQEALAMPGFLAEALQRVRWHAAHGHRIVIVSGTLEPLAERAGRLLETELATRGMRAFVEVCATRLENMAGIWSGRIVGEAMFGEAKARAVWRFCTSHGIALAGCFAYGDSANDRCMLEAVGRPSAVNPSDDLARIARRNGWPVLRWKAQGATTLQTQRSRPSLRSSVSEVSAEASRRPAQAAAVKQECRR